MGTILLVLNKLCSDSVSINISCNYSPEIRDNSKGEIVQSSIMDLDGIACLNDISLSIIGEGEKCLWFINKGNPRKSVSSFADVHKDFGELL